MKLIHKDTLIAEIEKRKHRNILNEGAFEEDIDILSFINHLEVKEVDLEKELNGYGYHYDYISLADRKELVDFAKHFFELGLKASNPLTWQDVKLLSEIGEDFMNSLESNSFSEEEYYQEILKRFKVQKGE